jgi:energy-coupling factor transporter ATP-binding protein EcfA2
MIDIDHVSWSYPHAEEPSVRELDLQVGRGEFVVLCGASGSGKSTALRLMNGLIPHFYDDGALEGRVTVDGLVTEAVEIDDVGRLTGTVQQHPRRQFFTGTVIEELAFAMENFGLPREQIRARVHDKLETLRGRVPITTPLGVLSGGQQQQVAIAASSTHGPRVLLLDEPSSNLSADAIGRLHETLRVLQQEGVAVVVAEHRLRYLGDLLDRVIVMEKGGITAEWSAEEFASTSDAELTALGLRGEVRAARLPVLPAAGASVRGSTCADEVPAGTLELRDVVCWAGDRTILAIERMAFPAGRVTAVRGTNGAGKSTLARLITGLRGCDGEVRYDGHRLGRRARQGLSALVMQDVQRQLFTETVHAEIALARRNVLGGEDSSAEVQELLEELDLTGLEGRHPLSLSGGQQQRLVIAGARISGRSIMIFDEPSSGVDRRHLMSISAQIRQVAEDGAVVLLISHDEDLLALAADQQVTLEPFT